VTVNGTGKCTTTPKANAIIEDGRVIEIKLSGGVCDKNPLLTI
jgi:hypothetical protein